MENLATKAFGSKGETKSLTLNVKGKKVSVPSRLSGELLTRLVQAMHDALIQETKRPGPLGKVIFSGPVGPVTVNLFGTRVGDWRREYRRRFASAITRYGGEIVTLLARSLLTGRPVSYRRIGIYGKYFIGAALTQQQHRFVHGRVDAFIAQHGASGPSHGAAQKDVTKILLYVAECGVPPKAVILSGDGVRVNMLRVAAVAKVSLAGINLYGLAADLQAELDKIAARSPWSIDQARYLPTTNNPHGRVTQPGIVVDFEKLHVARSGLLDELLDTFTVPADHRSVQILVRHISLLLLSTNGNRIRGAFTESARRILQAPVVELNGQDAIDLAEGLKMRLERREVKLRTKHEYIGGFFGRIADVFERRGKVRPKYRVSKGRQVKSNGRGLVSDQPDAHASRTELQPSIVHVAVGAPDIARAKAIEHLDDRLARIDVACDREIEAFLHWREFLSSAELSTPSVENIRHRTSMIGLDSNLSNDYRRWQKEGDLTDIVACMIDAVRHANFFRQEQHDLRRNRAHSVKMADAFPRLCEQFPFLVHWIRAGSKGHWLTWLPLSYWYVPRIVQLAIEIKIQVATAWNRATIRNLQADGINLKEMELQAIKGKVGKNQGGGIESADHLLRRGLELMLEHDRNVTDYWSRERSGVFVVPVHRKGTYIFGFGVGHKLLSEFAQWHDLPHFTREQLRNQKAASRFLKKNDPHEIQGLLGHGDLGVTTGYLKHGVLAVLNRANIASFQRQLAASIIWAIEGDDGLSARSFSQKDVNRQLLFPVSDRQNGSETMPNGCDVWLANTSRSLRIDSLRLSHLARQRAYYAAHWQRLRAENPKRFEIVHLPRIEFTAALWAVVADSPYAGLLEGTQ